jgi:hypothetical protein
MKIEARRQFIDNVMDYVIENFDVDTEHITCALVNCGASEYLIVAHNYYLLVEVKTKINHKYKTNRYGIKTGYLIPSLSCGEYIIGFSNVFANVKIVSGLWKAYKTLRAIKKFHPIHLVAVEYTDVILSQYKQTDEN